MQRRRFVTRRRGVGVLLSAATSRRFREGRARHARRTVMRRGALYLGAALCVATGSSASAQMTRPFEVLEGARRDRIEGDKRMAREAAEQRRKEKERVADYAKQES